MHGQNRHQLAEELPPRDFSLWSIGASRAMRRFDQSNNGNGHILTGSARGDFGQNLMGVLSFPLGRD